MVERQSNYQPLHYCVQLETLQYSVDRVGTDLYTTRAQVTHLNRELKDNIEKYLICYTQMCAAVHIRIHTYIHTYIHTHMVGTHTHTHAHTHMCTHTYMHTNTKFYSNLSGWRDYRRIVDCWKMCYKTTQRVYWPLRVKQKKWTRCY